MKNQTISSLAYAKINLFLNVVGVLPNGYHEIESVMQTVSLADEITLRLTERSGDENEIVITCDSPIVPLDRRNIAWKCAEKFFDRFGIHGLRAEIGIKKRIPQGGGLAGGSTDGAAILRMLNEVSGTHASLDELCEIGAKVGADIPFCVVGGTQICRGIGEKLEKIEKIEPKYHVLIAAADSHISTPDAYKMIDEVGVMAKYLDKTSESVTAALRRGEIPNNCFNIFEDVMIPSHPEVGLMKKKLSRVGADAVMMSGSGPSVFGLFESKTLRDKAYEELKREFRVFPCEIVNGL